MKNIVNLNQAQTYQNAITAENLSQSMGSGILKKPYQLSVPQPGTGYGSAMFGGLVSGSVSDPVGMNGKNGRSVGRYSISPVFTHYTTARQRYSPIEW